MLFDIGPLEMLTLLVVAVVVLGPEKLPRAVSETAALVRRFRSFSATARNEIRQELDPGFADLDLRDLDLHDLDPRAPAHQAGNGTADEPVAAHLPAGGPTPVGAGRRT
ncbi:Sec-independent protein translocase protein TatB [Streptomyces sp. NPDC002309]